MQSSGNTVLITGGGSGIGLALAEIFLKEGNEVIICGRRENRLAEAGLRLPGLHTRVCDVTDPEDRDSLFKWATARFPALNLLINNAGVMRMIDFTKGLLKFKKQDGEIKTNLEAPLYLTALFLPHLLGQKSAAVVNVSSGLAFIPLALTPVYCATKAAIHSFSISLRHQLKDSGVKVFELIPPLVKSELGLDAGMDRESRAEGIEPGELAAAFMAGLKSDQYEIAVGPAKGLVEGSHSDPEGVFQRLNQY